MKRNIILFDTETTGLGNKDEVIQLCAIILTQDGKKLKFKDVINFYCDTNVHIPQEAVNIHGIDNKALYKLSDGKYFEEQLVKCKDFVDPSIPTVYMAYNINFDKRLINQTLEQNGYAPIDFGQQLNFMPADASRNYNVCLMEIAKQAYTNGRRVKLQTLIDKYMDENHLKMLHTKLKAAYKIKTASDGYHDALYDTVACLVLLTQSKIYLAY